MDVLQGSVLFAGVDADELRAMLTCLAPKRARFEKGETILAAGAHTDAFGLLLSGEAHVVQEDCWGNRNLMAALTVGELFAESFAARPDAELNVSVVACAPCEALFLQLRRVLDTCPSACPHHRRLIENLLAVLAEKNQRLNEKLSHLSQRSTREKIMSYLSAESRRRGGTVFEIPFNRQQLADYLSVDRSALSTELGRLKAEGLLDFERSSFKIIRKNM